MKRILIYAPLLLVTFIPSISNVKAATFTATSCSQTDVQQQVDAASDGDLVVIPAGSCTWVSYVSWSNKNISLVGAGIDKTVITADSTMAFSVVNNKKSSFRISGMTIQGIGNSQKVFKLNSEASSTGVKGWRIDHIRFNFSKPNGIYAFYISGINWGLIDNCIFDGAGYLGVVVAGYVSSDGWPPPNGLGYYSWSQPLTFGNDEAIYVEDCTWNFPVGSYVSSVNDMYYGGKMVFRYNKVTNTYYQSHAARGQDRGGNIWSEVYNNTFNSTDPNWTRAIHIRGGSGIIYNNTFAGYFSTIHVDNQRSCGANTSLPFGACDGTSSWDGNAPGETGWPCLDQIGRGPGPVGNQPSLPLYGWNNGSDPSCAMNGPCNNNRIISLNTACLSPNHIKTTGDKPTHSDGSLDFINSGSNQKPGYTHYAYPHPLREAVTSAIEPPRNMHISQ